ncbi:MAG: 50S ribosomal protein L18 [Candidatus Nealsonbacteria bacterium]|nr:50S ribosomal protein L18 [Candidatus Nealsonbacteria bacterium]
MKTEDKREKRKKRHQRIREKISGTAKKPRLCVFRSNKHIYAQLIDDEREVTLASATDLDLGAGAKKGKKSKKKSLTKTEKAFNVGELIAEKAKEMKVKEVVFDRAGYKYHGRVKALAEGARKGGLKL